MAEREGEREREGVRQEWGGREGGERERERIVWLYLTQVNARSCNGSGLDDCCAIFVYNTKVFLALNESCVYLSCKWNG